MIRSRMPALNAKMMHVVTAGVPVLLTLVVVACASDDRNARDAGAEHPVQLSLSAEPVLSVGTVDGAPEDVLFRVRGAERLSDGTLMIVNEGTSELRFYDSDGKHLRSVGREGEGPGEFRNLTSAHVIRGDTIVTWDSSLARVSFFTADGTIVSDVTVDLGSVSLSMAGRSASVFPAAVYPLHDGTLVVEPNPPFWLTRGFVSEGGFDPDSVASRGVHQIEVPLLVMERDGSIADTLGWVPGAPLYVGERGWIQPHRFGDRPMIATGGTRIYTGVGRPWAFRVGSAEGLGEPVTVGRSRQPLTEEIWNRSIENSLQYFADPDAMRSFYGGMPRPDSLPAYGAMRVDRDGNVWLREYRPFASTEPTPSLWLAFDDEGQSHASLQLPPGMDILSFGEDEIVVLTEDELDVERVQVYRLERAAGRDEVDVASIAWVEGRER